MLALITGKKNSILRSENKEIKIITPNIKKLALDMFIKMHECKGIGLAAPQIGKNFINPVINKISKPYNNEVEGCLSIPKQQGLVKRARRVNIRAKNLKGEEFKLQAKGFLARVLQHEYDHLQGVLIADKWHIIKHKI
ncbi:MAG: Peptide deformylase [Candidatus Roizmanbacteria bacterium GW2011_GWA2_32_13]|uniref:Peptide deformylase n=1 Tax=Candidatus Roizmanbacteria bacterium GW2011_GWA2_32_13 TaxID=1618475 RepID=A0A0F9ZE96_9BACT|nr:MAG: Peptide deformylase [Candidatus Roizmanbacteria bacterium GW2011_GWA2_32_13]